VSVLESEFLRWVDLVGDLTSGPARAFPHLLVAQRLTESFGAPTSYTWLDEDGTVGFAFPDRSSDWVPTDYVERWLDGADLLHPLARWFMVTGDSTAMSLGRVPEQLAPREITGALSEELRPYEIEQQLSIPCHSAPTSYATFVLATTGADFDDAQLALARRIQPLLVLLHRRARFDARVTGTADLTQREAAVLDLLTRGASSTAIGHALGISPRTAEKHLENVYRKLGVRDRLAAVLVAREAGGAHWRGEQPADSAPPAARQGPR